MKSKRVVITGMGIFCSIGKSVDGFAQSLKEGRSGIGPVTLFDASNYPSRIGAEVRGYQPEKYFKKRELKRLSILVFASGPKMTITPACSSSATSISSGTGLKT